MNTSSYSIQCNQLSIMIFVCNFVNENKNEVMKLTKDPFEDNNVY